MAWRLSARAVVSCTRNNGWIAKRKECPAGHTIHVQKILAASKTPFTTSNITIARKTGDPSGIRWSSDNQKIFWKRPRMEQ